MKGSPVILARCVAVCIASLLLLQEASSGAVNPVSQLDQTKTQAPARLVAENIDQSPVNKQTQGQLVKIVDAWIAADKAQDAPAKLQAKNDLIKVHEGDNKNVGVLTWLGYLYTVDGELAKAIPVLEAVKGKSSDADVNLSNLRNLSLAYYASAMYEPAQAHLLELNKLDAKNPAILVLIATTYVVQEKFAEAVPYYQEARSLIDADDAGMPRLESDLSVALIKSGRTDDALKLMEECETKGTATETMLSWMGFTYLQRNDTAAAIRVLEKARAMSQDNVQVINNLANAYAKSNQAEDRKKAIDLYVQLTRLQPTLATPWYNAGSLFLMSEDYRQAKEFLTKSVGITRDPFALNNLGRAHEGLNEMKDAATRYSEASELRPENALFARNAGLAFMRIRDDQKSLTYLRRAIANGDEDPVLPKMVAEIMTRSGDDAEALAALESLRNKYEGDPSYWFNVGVLRQRTGNEKGAEEAYRKCLEIRPDDVDAINNLGLLLYKRGDYEGSLTLFEKLAGLKTTSIDAKINLAAALARTGRTPAAINVWKEIVRMAPERVNSRLDLADALYNTGDADGARFHYATALKQEPNNVRALNGLGLWHLLQSSNVEAEKLFRKAIQVDENYLPPYNNLAITLERQNRKKEAIEILERALKIKPDFEDARRNLARLKGTE